MTGYISNQILYCGIPWSSDRNPSEPCTLCPVNSFFFIWFLWVFPSMREKHKKSWNSLVVWLNIRALLFMQDIVLSDCLQRKYWTMSSWQGAATPPDVALTWAVLKEMVLLISQTSSIHGFLSHLGLDIYCIIARTLTEREAVPLTQQMRRSSWNVLAELLMLKRARNGGCTFLNTNTHFLTD